jgi:tetratricopeptide (TPR) repeat protein
MRKLFFSFLLTATITGVYAQKLEDVQKDLSNNKFNEAKEKIDKFLTEPKNQTNANAWYYKGKVYTSLAAMDTTHSLTYDAANIGFESFKKYQQMDAKNTMMILDQNVGLFQIYDLYYNQGVRKYNDKDYAAAFEKMKKALEVEKYIFDRGYSFNDFSFTALDTQLVNLTASAAYLAKKEAEAIP